MTSREHALAYIRPRVEEFARRQRGGELVELSHAIHAEPELALAEEHRV